MISIFLSLQFVKFLLHVFPLSFTKICFTSTVRVTFRKLLSLFHWYFSKDHWKLLQRCELYAPLCVQATIKTLVVQSIHAVVHFFLSTPIFLTQSYSYAPLCLLSWHNLLGLGRLAEVMGTGGDVLKNNSKIKRKIIFPDTHATLPMLLLFSVFFATQNKLRKMSRRHTTLLYGRVGAKTKLLRKWIRSNID